MRVPQANAQLNFFTEIRVEREKRILNDLVNKVRAGDVSFEYLYSRIAAISELRHLEADLRRDLREAQEEASNAA